jgi:hypothetical protein
MHGTCIKIKYPRLFWNCLEQECTNFPRLYEASENSTHRIGDIMEVPFWGSTYVGIPAKTFVEKGPGARDLFTRALEMKTYEGDIPLIAPSSVGVGEQSLLSAVKMKPTFLFPCTFKVWCLCSRIWNVLDVPLVAVTSSIYSSHSVLAENGKHCIVLILDCV